MRKLTLEYVKQYFQEQGCEFLEKEYKNSRTKIKYRCICGNISEIKFNNFKTGYRCKKCGIGKRTEQSKHTFKYVKNYFIKKECKLLETNYINCKTLMNYKCSCGSHSKISFNSFKKGSRCNRCGTEKRTKKKRLSFKYVQQHFRNYSCKLLESKYISNDTKMKYLCSCGEKNIITFSCFQQGQRCRKCAIKKISGKNNYGYNCALTDKDREDRRKINGYKQWVKNVYKKDNYTCQKCYKKGGKLNAHHIEGYAENKKIRTIVSNGIVLCKKCHNIFHSFYGKKNNNKNQLEKYLKITFS